MVAIHISSPLIEQRRTRTPGGSALSLLYTAYQLEGSDEAWLSRVVKAMEPLLSRGAGIVGYYYELSPDSTSLRVTSPVLLNCPTGFLEVLRQASGLVPPEVMRVVYSGKPCKSLSQVFARVRKDASVGPGVNAALDTFRKAGTVDQLLVNALEADGSGVGFGASTRRRLRFPPRTAGTLARAARHLAAARRLRKRLRVTSMGRTTLEAEAILSEGGQVLHAEGEAKAARERSLLAEAGRALMNNRNRFARRDPEQAVRLWKALVDGRWSLVDSVESDGKRLLLVRKNVPDLPDARALTLEERHALSLFAEGHSTTLVAYELGLSYKVVLARLASVLRKLKLRSRAELESLAVRRTPR